MSTTAITASKDNGSSQIHLPSATSTAMVPYKSSFGGLPIEVRQMIWHLLLPQRRLVPVTSFITVEEFEEAEEDGRRHQSALWDYISQRTSLPVGFQINLESRNYFLKHHRLMFKHTLSGRPIYFNPQKDILLMIDNYRTTFRKLMALGDDKKAEDELEDIKKNVRSIAFTQEDGSGEVVSYMNHSFPNATSVMFSGYNLYRNDELSDDASGEFIEAWRRKHGVRELPKITFMDFDYDPNAFTHLQDKYHVLDPVKAPSNPTHHNGIEKMIDMGPKREYNHLKGVLNHNCRRITWEEYFDPGNRRCLCGEHEDARACRDESRQEGAYHVAYSEWELDHDGDMEDFEFEWSREVELEYYPDDPGFVDYFGQEEG